MDAFICDAQRTPIGRFGKARNLPPQERWNRGGNPVKTMRKMRPRLI